MMKVFCCKNQYPYGGGIIMVAANSKEEAFSVAAQDKDVKWEFYKTESGEPASDIYPISEWYEEKRLSSRLIKPMVIVENNYLYGIKMQ